MKKWLLVILSVMMTVASYAQPALPAQCKVWLPIALDNDVISKKDAQSVLKSGYGQSPAPAASRKSYWIVFSDRDNNTVYSASDGKTSCGTLKFNERVIIADVSPNGYALVYSEPKNERYPLISSAAQSKGWIPLTRLLLWTKCLADDAGVSYKAVICANLNASGNDSEGWLYKHPSGKAVEKLKTDMHFYFIMKEEGSKVLLGYYASQPTDGSRGLYGWVDVNSFVPWNQRTCLEPTWNPSDVEWFAANGKKWQVYANQNKMTGKAPQEAVFTTAQRKAKDQYSTEYMYRTMSKNDLRYPILEGCTDKVYHCSSFGTLNPNGKTTPSADLDADLEAAIANLENAKVINIGIVIDGTSSMQKYFTSVKNAIVEGCKYFSKDNKVNVAVAIYRDKEDGQYVFECFPSAGGFTTPNNQNLKKFLDTGGAYGVKSVATGDTESVYYGIKTAIEKFNFNPKNSNLLLVVGDCGDNGKMGVKREEIINLAADKKISMMAFQVRNRDLDAFQSFNTQLTYLMKQSMQKRFDALAKQAGHASTAKVVASQFADGSGWEIKDQQDGKKKYDIYRYVHRRTPQKNAEMDVNQLASLMETTIGDWNGILQQLQDAAKSFIDIGGFEANDGGDGTMTDALIDLFGGDRERYERIKKRNSLTSFRGWTYKYEPASKRSFYKVVVFFPAPELLSLIEKLGPVYQVARARSNDRQPYYNAMVKLAGSLVAQDKIKEAKYKEIIAKVCGLDSATTDLGGPSLADIVDPNVFNQSDYLKLVNDMVKSFEKLQRIMSEDYPLIYEMAGSKDKYYWLPIEYLPGFNNRI